MSFMRNIQDMLQQGRSGLPGSQNADQRNQPPAQFDLGGLLGPAALGGLAGALFGGKGARPALGGALLAAGGAALWKMYQQRMRDAGTGSAAGPSSAPAEELTFSAPSEQGAIGTEKAERLVRAMIFAAKSDGRIDAEEQSGIAARIRDLNLDQNAQDLVNKALAEPLDPKLVARGVTDAEEAMQLFTLSCAVIDLDHFMERAYLDALADALRIPDDLKDDITANFKPATA